MTAMEGVFKNRLDDLQGEMNTTKANWLKMQEESQAREDVLRNQVAQLTIQLKGAELQLTPDPPEYEVIIGLWHSDFRHIYFRSSPVPEKVMRRSTRKSTQTPKTPISPQKTAKCSSRLTSDAKKTGNVSEATEATASGTNKVSQPKTPNKAPASGTQMYRLQKLDVPSDATRLKVRISLFYRLCIYHSDKYGRRRSNFIYASFGV